MLPLQIAFALFLPGLNLVTVAHFGPGTWHSQAVAVGLNFQWTTTYCTKIFLEFMSSPELNASDGRPWISDLSILYGTESKEEQIQKVVVM